MTDGEQWAAAELDALRAGQFRPGAWRHFLRASFRRAKEARDSKPELVSQSRIWSAAGLGIGMTVCAWPRIASPRASRFTLWWLTTAAMLDWHLGMLEGPGGERRDQLGTADALTLTRIALVPFLEGQGDPEHRSAPTFATLLALAGASDALDGILARHAGPTRLGRDLDTVADALTGAAAARVARRAGWLPTSVARLVAARNAIPVVVVSASYLRTGRRPATDAFGATRRLAPVLLTGLAIAPFSRWTGAGLTSAASIGSFALAWHTRSTT
ncbi:MAG TPA: CDP-alcohol phosphatidyltransferase family protein [Solirubrobacteraceae bacterium]|nr:CDP-alcohol phosphatidyltransferase family protein [Solirubrobacteraceae bacterium]